MVMKYSLKSFIVLSMCSGLLAAAAADTAGITLEIEKKFELGMEKVTFSDRLSVAEDFQGRIYVLDSKRHKVFKFSPGGRLLSSFGRKGRGPGDLYMARHIAVSEKNRLIISDAHSVSVFDLNGKCLVKYNASVGGILWNKKYAGGNKFLAEKAVNRYDVPPLVLATLTPEVKIIDNNVLTCSSPELYKEAGVFHESISPDIWYAYGGGRSVAALSEKYLIKIIGPDGKVVKIIKRNIKKPPLSKKEREYIIETKINQWKDIDQDMKNGLKKTIPGVKTLIAGITMSASRIFVRRVKDDITDLEAPVPVDIYSVAGEFLGAVKINSFPLHATDKHFYFKSESEEGDITLSKYAYKLKRMKE